MTDEEIYRVAQRELHESERYQHLNRVIVEINKKYNFGEFKRSPEDDKAWKEAYKELNAFYDDIDTKYPLAPCSACGTHRSVLVSSMCLNFGKCKLAPIGFGG